MKVRIKIYCLNSIAMGDIQKIPTPSPYLLATDMRSGEKLKKGFMNKVSPYYNLAAAVACDDDVNAGRGQREPGAFCYECSVRSIDGKGAGGG